MAEKESDDHQLSKRRSEAEIARLELEIEELRLKKQRLQGEQKNLLDHEGEEESKKMASSSSSSSSGILELNVGGQVFAMSREMILQYNSPYFQRLLEAGETGGDGIIVKASQVDASGRHFVDRSPDLFRQILEYMRGSLDIEELTEKDKKALRAEAAYYQLDDLAAKLRPDPRVHDRFKQAEEQKCIFSDGLPELGPLSETTKFTSNPSVPTEEQHKTAKLEIADFKTLSDLAGPPLPYPKTNIWNQISGKTGTLGGYSNEAGVNDFVKMVIVDILESLGIRDEVTIRGEIEIMRNRPDFMLILVNGHPIGTIEGKQPGKVAMHHPNILGEVYDQLMHLCSIFRVNNPFAILTSYEEWRICWLNLESSNKLAAMSTLPERIPFETPTKKKPPEEKESLGNEPSPPPPSTPSRAKGVGKLQEVEDDEDEEDADGESNEDRVFCGTEVMEWTDTSLPVVLASVIRKMMIARQGDEPKVLRLANEKTSVWKAAPSPRSLNFSLCISSAVKNFFLWEDLGQGADGRAFLVSGGTKGAVGVLKFFFNDAERKAQHELNMWKQVYSHLLPVAQSIRIVEVMGQTTLLMPWFQCPERTRSTLAAVEKTLREDFMVKKIRHDDVAWRNVGVYNHGGKTKAVVFDMQKVHPDDKGEDWVKLAVASLSEKLN